MDIKGGMYLRKNYASGSVVDYSHWSIPRTKDRFMSVLEQEHGCLDTVE